MSDRKTMPCPACRENGSDKKGKHLTVFPSGKFACAVHPGDKAHNRRIVELRPDLGKDDASTALESKRPISNPRASKNEKPGKVVEKYLYHDKGGKLLYEIRRHEPKDFRPYLPGAEWPGIGKTPLVPYRLHLITGADKIIIVEGEKDCDTLEALGYVATTNPFGAEKWREEWSHYFEGKHVVIIPDNDDPGRRHAEQVESCLKPVAKSIKRVTIPAPAKDISDHLAGMSDSEARAAVEGLLRQPDPLDALLDARRFDLSNPPAKPAPVLLIHGKAISTSGNLTGIYSQIKAGTTALQGAMMAALMEPTGDCLGMTGQNPVGLPVVHFDTEQSPFDHHGVILQMLKRAGREQPPKWFRSYCLTDVATKDRRKALAHEMKRAAIAGKLRAAFIDGVADLCLDPNDSAEAFGLVEELHRLAITFDCPILCRLHENPGPDGKTRGHLGSQLERKAETNLRLSKDADGVTTVYTERSRHCHIPKESGPRFAWDEATGMHISCATVSERKASATVQKYQEMAVGIFDNDRMKSMSWGELIDALEPIAGNKKNAEHRIEAMKKYQAIRFEFGRYRLCNP